jgi:hypothetical protein
MDSSNVVKFADIASRRVFSRRPRISKNGTPEQRVSLPESAAEEIRKMVREEIDYGPGTTATAVNARLRIERREPWRRAEAAVQYWNARLEFESAVERAQRFGIPEGRSHASFNHDDESDLVANWRAAIVRQLLTPAPDGGAVKWKQAAFAGDSYLDVKPERVERAIADDLAFLAAHPTKRSNSEAMERRRLFNDAMRQRIREVAASRDLSDEEIKPVLTLKHQEVGRFIEAHGVNLTWLLEGEGQIFKS